MNVPDGLVARIVAEDLAEVLGNILENAARHARSEVAVDVRPEGPEVVITVSDDGPGIPVERLSEAIARGVRLDAKGAGTGLGLAIVGDVVEAWGGTLTLENGKPGLVVTVRFGGRASPLQRTAAQPAGGGDSKQSHA
jgi:signal transduction histidine kinase